MLLIIFKLIITLFLGQLFFIYLKQIYQRSIICKHIPGPSILPIIGSVQFITDDPRKMLPNFVQVMKTYGKLMQVWFGPTQFIVTTDVRIVEKLLSSAKRVEKLESVYRFFKPALGNSLATNSNVESWRKRRKMLTPAFHFTILNEALKVFNSSIDILIHKIDEHVEDGEAFNIYPYGAHYAFDVICETAMGIKINSQVDSAGLFLQAVQKILELTNKRIFSITDYCDFIYYLTQDGKEYKRYIKMAREITCDVIAKRRLLKEKNKLDSIENELHGPQAFLDTLLDSTIDDRPLTIEEIREEVDVIMFGGFDTTSRTIGFLFYALGNHPEVQTKLFNEIRTKLGNNESKPLIMDDLNKLKYLEAVIKETLRIYPPGIVLPRQLNDELKVDEITIPGNRGIVVFVYGIHHDKDYFPDPEEFKPERFLDESINRNPFTFIPFSAGPRNCIGQKYALCQLKFLIVKILQNFELISAGPEYKLELRLSVALTADNGTFIRVKNRTYN